MFCANIKSVLPYGYIIFSGKDRALCEGFRYLGFYILIFLGVVMILFVVI